MSDNIEDRIRSYVNENKPHVCILTPCYGSVCFVNYVHCLLRTKEVFEHFKKHKVEPVIFNFRHRYFWDGGVNCITQDLYREGTQEDYFG